MNLELTKDIISNFTFNNAHNSASYEFIKAVGTTSQLQRMRALMDFAKNSSEGISMTFTVLRNELVQEAKLHGNIKQATETKELWGAL